MVDDWVETTELEKVVQTVDLWATEMVDQLVAEWVVLKADHLDIAKVDRLDD